MPEPESRLPVPPEPPEPEHDSPAPGDVDMPDPSTFERLEWTLEPGDVISHEPLPPITIPERLGAIILICTSVAIGLYPQMLLKIITPALNSPLFDGVRKGGW